MSAPPSALDLLSSAAFEVNLLPENELPVILNDGTETRSIQLEESNLSERSHFNAGPLPTGLQPSIGSGLPVGSGSGSNPKVTGVKRKASSNEPAYSAQATVPLGQHIPYARETAQQEQREQREQRQLQQQQQQQQHFQNQQLHQYPHQLPQSAQASSSGVPPSLASLLGPSHPSSSSPPPPPPAHLSPARHSPPRQSPPRPLPVVAAPSSPPEPAAPPPDLPHLPSSPARPPLPTILPEDSGIIRCICSYADDDGFTIQCERCFGWQHGLCVSISPESVPDIYICPECDRDNPKYPQNRRDGVTIEERERAEHLQKLRKEAERGLRKQLSRHDSLQEEEDELLAKARGLAYEKSLSSIPDRSLSSGQALQPLQPQQEMNRSHSPQPPQYPHQQSRHPSQPITYPAQQSFSDNFLQVAAEASAQNTHTTKQKRKSGSTFSANEEAENAPAHKRKDTSPAVSTAGNHQAQAPAPNRKKRGGGNAQASTNSKDAASASGSTANAQQISVNAAVAASDDVAASNVSLAMTADGVAPAASVASSVPLASNANLGLTPAQPSRPTRQRIQTQMASAPQQNADTAASNGNNATGSGAPTPTTQRDAFLSDDDADSDLDGYGYDDRYESWQYEYTPISRLRYADKATERHVKQLIRHFVEEERSERTDDEDLSSKGGSQAVDGRETGLHINISEPVEERSTKRGGIYPHLQPPPRSSGATSPRPFLPGGTSYSRDLQALRDRSPAPSSGSSTPGPASSSGVASALSSPMLPVILSGPFPPQSELAKLSVKPLATSSLGLAPPTCTPFSGPTCPISAVNPYPRPTIHGVFTATSHNSGSLLSTAFGEVVSGKNYRRDRLNQWKELGGMLKAHTRGVAQPWDLVLDQRRWSDETRFIRMGCHPNVFIKPVIVRKALPAEAEAASARASLVRSQPSGKKGKKRGGRASVAAAAAAYPVSTSEDPTDDYELAFGLYALQDIAKREELVLPFDWADDHVVHSLHTLLFSPHLVFPSTSISSTRSSRHASAEYQTSTQAQQQVVSYDDDGVPSTSTYSLPPKVDEQLLLSATRHLFTLSRLAAAACMTLLGTTICACEKRRDCSVAWLWKLAGFTESSNRNGQSYIKEKFDVEGCRLACASALATDEKDVFQFNERGGNSRSAKKIGRKRRADIGALIGLSRGWTVNEVPVPSAIPPSPPASEVDDDKAEELAADKTMDEQSTEPDHGETSDILASADPVPRPTRSLDGDMDMDIDEEADNEPGQTARATDHAPPTPPAEKDETSTAAVNIDVQAAKSASLLDLLFTPTDATTPRPEPASGPTGNTETLSPAKSKKKKYLPPSAAEDEDDDSESDLTEPLPSDAEQGDEASEDEAPKKAVERKQLKKVSSSESLTPPPPSPPKKVAKPAKRVIAPSSDHEHEDEDDEVVVPPSRKTKKTLIENRKKKLVKAGETPVAGEKKEKVKKKRVVEEEEEDNPSIELAPQKEKDKEEEVPKKKFLAKKKDKTKEKGDANLEEGPSGEKKEKKPGLRFKKMSEIREERARAEAEAKLRAEAEALAAAEKHPESQSATQAALLQSLGFDNANVVPQDIGIRPPAWHATIAAGEASADMEIDSEPPSARDVVSAPTEYATATASEAPGRSAFDLDEIPPPLPSATSEISDMNIDVSEPPSAREVLPTPVQTPVAPSAPPEPPRRVSFKAYKQRFGGQPPTAAPSTTLPETEQSKPETISEEHPVADDAASAPIAEEVSSTGASGKANVLAAQVAETLDVNSVGEAVRVKSPTPPPRDPIPPPAPKARLSFAAYRQRLGTGPSPSGSSTSPLPQTSGDQSTGETSKILDKPVVETPQVEKPEEAMQLDSQSGAVQDRRALQRTKDLEVLPPTKTQPSSAAHAGQSRLPSPFLQDAATATSAQPLVITSDEPTRDVLMEAKMELDEPVLPAANSSDPQNPVKPSTEMPVSGATTPLPQPTPVNGQSGIANVQFQLLHSLDTGTADSPSKREPEEEEGELIVDPNLEPGEVSEPEDQPSTPSSQAAPKRVALGARERVLERQRAKDSSRERERADSEKERLRERQELDSERDRQREERDQERAREKIERETERQRERDAEKERDREREIRLQAIERERERDRARERKEEEERSRPRHLAPPLVMHTPANARSLTPPSRNRSLTPPPRMAATASTAKRSSDLPSFKRRSDVKTETESSLPASSSHSANSSRNLTPPPSAAMQASSLGLSNTSTAPAEPPSPPRNQAQSRDPGQPLLQPTSKFRPLTSPADPPAPAPPPLQQSPPSGPRASGPVPTGPRNLVAGPPPPAFWNGRRGRPRGGPYMGSSGHMHPASGAGEAPPAGSPNSAASPPLGRGGPLPPSGPRAGPEPPSGPRALLGGGRGGYSGRGRYSDGPAPPRDRGWAGRGRGRGFRGGS